MTPVVTTIAEVRALVAAARRAGHSIGFIPTMGALHAGHASLIRASRAGANFTIVSIFVNAAQFGPNEDFQRYPRTLNADRELCAAIGADLIFAPEHEEMYPTGHFTSVEVRDLQDRLCGASRPGHFRGVATVVLKLFNIVLPDVAFFGQKDAQQVRIIQQMARDLDLLVRIATVPTVREPDGLAMSSRNRYLDPHQRQNATALRHALLKAEEMVRGGERHVRQLEEALRAEIVSTSGAVLDYAQVVDALTLRAIDTLQRPALAALAVFFGATRLIDNTTLTP
jgi:pantoate--beta-alanine ligase